MNPEDYMRLAIEEARKGEGFTNPNPMVGAVLVKDGRVVGKDYHHQYGGYHAERNAILNCGEDLAGAELFVTLEPCCHYGKTPPCTEIIIESGIRKVYVGCMDPNPLVAGGGTKRLRESGIEVYTGICERECRDLNKIFFHYIQTGRPYVVMKYAMTADGKIATRTGESKWITGEAARRRVHESRHKYMGIMAGIGTVLSDNPMLNCRIDGGKNPVRIICDTFLRAPLSAEIVKTAKDIPTWIATAETGKDKHKPYLDAGCEILVTPSKDGRVDLDHLMQNIGGRGIDSLLLEGGATLNYSALESGIVQAVQMYVAPKLFGGEAAKTPVGGIGIERPSQAFRLRDPRIRQIEEDILVEWEVDPCLRES